MPLAPEFVLPRDPPVALLRVAPFGDLRVWGLGYRNELHPKYIQFYHLSI